MSTIFGPLFTDKITVINRTTDNGYGAHTITPLYTNVPTMPFEDTVTLSYGEVIETAAYIGTFKIPPKYYQVVVGDIIVYNDKEYIVKNIKTIRGLFGPPQAIQLRVIYNNE